MAGVNSIVWFGIQYYTKRYLVEEWDRHFFFKPKEDVVDAYRRRMTNAGINITYEHIEALWDLGHLPITIWALPEGTRVPIGVPPMVMWNTHPDFFWLTNYLETSLSATLWGMCTSATIAAEYRKMFEHYAAKTGGAPEFIDWQGHDFSMRGMYGIEAAAMSGAGHLLSFTGTDTIPAIDFLEEYYFADSDSELIGGSVAATEHSVMCMGGELDELETYKRLITDVYPEGIVSIVSDTWDYWSVWTDILPQLKDEILNRPGKVVIRPDSGDPVKIICGDPEAPEGSPERLGTFELAWNLFGGTTTPQGYRTLNEHIGVIYGDSITPERCEAILAGLSANGFVPSMVFGIGSFTYQYNTRDTFGFAMKATYGEVEGVGRAIFKDPKTDRGDKKSAKGLLAVGYDIHHNIELRQNTTWANVKDCLYEEVFRNSEITKVATLKEIRERVRNGL
jgi:nicotinamide phosphoribosyltransferase